jgi:hypothetical protein
MPVLHTCRPAFLAIALLAATACTPLQRSDRPTAPPQQAYPALFEAVMQKMVRVTAASTRYRTALAGPTA